MPGKAAVKATNITETDMNFLDTLFGSLSEKPDFDWDAIAKGCNLASAKGAREKFRILSVKRGWFQGKNPGGAAATNTSGGVAGSKVEKKYPAKRAAAKKVVKEEPEDDDDDDEEVFIKEEFVKKEPVSAESAEM